MTRSARLSVAFLMLALSAGQVAAQAGGTPPDRIAGLRERALSASTPQMSVWMLKGWINADPALEPRREAVLALIAEAEAAFASGRGEDAARSLAQARTLAQGRVWSPEIQFAESLSVRPVYPIADNRQALQVRVAPTYAAAAAPARVRLSLRGADGASVRLGEHELTSLAGGGTVLSFAAPADVTGRSRLVSEVLVGDQVVSSSADVVLANDLSALEAETRRRLARLQPTPNAEALILYPFELARTVNSGARELERASFSRRLERSATVLEALEAGRDVVTRAVGDQDRARHFAAAGEIMPYRIYVPTWWEAGLSLPIVLALHGGGSDENEMFDYNDGRFGKLAEMYGYIVVSPFGYRPIGTWGNPIRLPSVYGADTREGRSLGDAATQRKRALSEQDALETLDLIAAEYGADTSRAFVTGHSMGGGGAWYLAHKYPERWAGLAASAGPFFTDNYDFDRLRNMGVLIAQGDDDPLSLNAQRLLAADLLKRGQGVTYLETPGAHHGNSFGLSLTGIFDFFERQKPSTGTPARRAHPVP